MDSSTLSKRLKQLANFCGCKNKSMYICICCDDDIDCLCELVFNVLKANINLKKKVLYFLKELRLELHILADVAVNIALKRKVLSRIGKKFFPLVRKYILPSLKKQLKRTPAAAATAAAATAAP